MDCTGLIGNPDISGVGVRISFYVQNFSLVLLVNRSWSDAPSAILTFISTSFGLTLAAIVQAAGNQLSLFQAIQVSHLVWLANFGTFFALASLSRRSARSKSEMKREGLINAVKIIAVLQTVFSMSLTIYMWRAAHHFGNQTECNKYVKYVFFGHDVPVLGMGRMAGLASSSLFTAAYLAVLPAEYFGFYTKHHRTPDSLPLATTASSTSQNSQQPIGELSSLTIGAAKQYPPSPKISPGSPRIPPLSIKKSRRRRWSWLSRKLDPMLAGIFVVQVAVFVYLVACSENLIGHNRLAVADTSATQWGFGQILSLVLVVPSIVATATAFHDQGFRKSHNRTARTRCTCNSQSM